METFLACFLTISFVNVAHYDDVTGALLRLPVPNTEESIAFNPVVPWRLTLARRENGRWRFRTAGPDELNLTLRVQRDGGRRIAIWHGDKLEVVVSSEADEHVGELRWHMHITRNELPEAIFAVDFPVLRVRPIGDPSRNKLALPRHSGTLVSNPFRPGFAITSDPMGLLTPLARNHCGLRYPRFWSMQMVYVYGEQPPVGLYLACEDTQGWVKDFLCRGMGDELEMTIRFYPEGNLESGRSFEVPYSVVTAGMSGDWWDAASRYREWALKQWWCKRGPLRERHGSIADLDAGIIEPFNGEERFGLPGTALERMEAFRRALEQAGASDVRLGVHFIGWSKEGDVTRDNPVCPAPEPRDDFIDALKKAQKDGWLCDIYLSTLDLAHRSPLWDKLLPCSAKTPKGEPLRSPTDTALCPACEPWQNYYADFVGKLVARLGVNAIYFDNYPQGALCYDLNHAHPLGGGRYQLQGFRKLVEGAITAARKHNPQLTCYNESKLEAIIDLMDGLLIEYFTGRDGRVMNFCGPGRPIPLVAAVYHDYISCIGGYRSKLRLGGIRPGQWNFMNAVCFAWGNILGPFDDGLAWEIVHGHDVQEGWREAFSFFAHLVEMRHRLIDWLGYGRLVRPPRIEPSVSHEQIPHLIVSAFWRDDRRDGILLLVNWTREEQFIQTIDLTRCSWLPDEFKVEPIGVKTVSKQRAHRAPLQLNLIVPPLHVVAFHIF